MRSLTIWLAIGLIFSGFCANASESSKLRFGNQIEISPVKYKPGKYISYYSTLRKKKRKFYVFDLKNGTLLNLKKKKPSEYGQGSKASSTIYTVKANKLKLTLDNQDYHLGYNSKTYDWVFRTKGRQIKYIDNAPPNSKALGAMVSGTKVLLIFASFHEDSTQTQPSFAELDLKSGFSKERTKHP